MYRIREVLERLRDGISERLGGARGWLGAHRRVALTALLIVALVAGLGIGIATLSGGPEAAEPAPVVTGEEPGAPASPGCTKGVNAVRAFMIDQGPGGVLEAEESARLDGLVKAAGKGCSPTALATFVSTELGPWTATKAKPGDEPAPAPAG